MFSYIRRNWVFTWVCCLNRLTSLTIKMVAWTGSQGIRPNRKSFSWSLWSSIQKLAESCHRAQGESSHLIQTGMIIGLSWCPLWLFLAKAVGVRACDIWEPSGEEEEEKKKKPVHFGWCINAWSWNNCNPEVRAVRKRAFSDFCGEDGGENSRDTRQSNTFCKNQEGWAGQEGHWQKNSF